MKKNLILGLIVAISCLLMTGCSLFRHNPKLTPEQKAEQEARMAEYQERIQKDTINGWYIPKDLDDCMAQLDLLLSDTDKVTIRQMAEDEVIRLHFGLGMWLRNNWSLWGGSRLSVYFHKMYIFHPDDMSGLILDKYYRYLRNEPFDLDAEVAHYWKYWYDSYKKERRKPSWYNEVERRLKERGDI